MADNNKNDSSMNGQSPNKDANQGSFANDRDKASEAARKSGDARSQTDTDSDDA